MFAINYCYTGHVFIGNPSKVQQQKTHTGVWVFVFNKIIIV